PLYRDNVPIEDAPIVARLKAAGGIMLGKTNTPTMGWSGATHNLLFGIPRNPWNLDRTPGGSSGGGGRHGAIARRHRRRRLDPYPRLLHRDLRLQGLLRSHPDPSGQRRLEPLARRSDDAYGRRRRADDERVRGAGRARSVFLAGRARRLRPRAAWLAQGAATGLERRPRVRRLRGSRGGGGLRAGGPRLPRPRLSRRRGHAA